MRIEQLNYFVTIASCGSMNKAAKKFYISQPALSSAITALEDELGLTLIKRTRQGITLTEAGEKVYHDSLKILDSIKQWKSISQTNKFFQENITISTPETPSYLILPEVVQKLQDTHPNIHLSIENASSAFSKHSNYEDYDLFLYARINDHVNTISDRLQQDILYEDYYCAFLSTDSSLAKKPYITMAELLQENLILYNNSLFNNFIDEHLYSHKKIFYSQHKEAIMAMIAKNHYVSVFQSMRRYNNYYVDNNLICVRPIIDNMISYKHIFIYPTYNRITPSQKIVVNYIKEAYEHFSLKTLKDRQQMFSHILSIK